MLRRLFSKPKGPLEEPPRVYSGTGRLPVEIYPVVFGFLTYSPSALKTLRLVSVTLRREVEPFIRIVASIHRGRLKIRTQYLRNIIKYPATARLIRSFRFVGSRSAETVTHEQMTWEYWGLLRDALRCMVQLEYLELIDLPAAWDEWDSGLGTNLLANCSSPRLATVCISNSNYVPFFQSLKSFPSYEKLAPRS